MSTKSQQLQIRVTPQQKAQLERHLTSPLPMRPAVARVELRNDLDELIAVGTGSYVIS